MKRWRGSITWLVLLSFIHQSRVCHNIFFKFLLPKLLDTKLPPTFPQESRVKEIEMRMEERQADQQRGRQNSGPGIRSRVCPPIVL